MVNRTIPPVLVRVVPAAHSLGGGGGEPGGGGGGRILSPLRERERERERGFVVVFLRLFPFLFFSFLFFSFLFSINDFSSLQKIFFSSSLS